MLCVFSYTHVYGKRVPRHQSVWSFGILQQAVRWHSLHLRNTSFFLSSPYRERTESAELAASCFPYTCAPGWRWISRNPDWTTNKLKEKEGGGRRSATS